MQNENRYVKTFQPLLKAVAEDRRWADRTAFVVETYAGAIITARGRVKQMQTLASKALKSREGEIIYFREIWPTVYGNLFYYHAAHNFLSKRAMVPAEKVPALVRSEGRAARGFLQKNWEFWLNYRSRAQVIDDQFMRTYSQGCIHDPLSLVVDTESATLASYKAAWGLAFTDLLTLLNQGLGRMAALSDEAEDLADFGWACTDADAVEWLYGLHAGSVILHKGEPADIAHLGRWFKLNFRKEIVNIYDRFKAVRNRKKDRAPFMRRLLGALEKRMDRAEGKG